MTNPNNVGRFMFGVGGLIQYRDTNEILLLKRATEYSDFNQDKWELLFGRKDQIEGVEDALRREAKEELGLENFDLLKVLRVWHFFRGAKEAGNEIIGITFWCRTSQRDFRLSAEHSECKWVLPEEAMKLITVRGIQDDVRAFIQHRNELRCTLSTIDGDWKVL